MRDSILKRVNSPKDLKSLNRSDKERLAVEIRDFLLSHVSKTGGHLASNLGVVELTIAMHAVLDETNEIVWDVGHQSYVHKILTGRMAAFDTLRKKDGLSGFPKRAESMYDCFDTGHSSTSISAALGIAAAKRVGGEPGAVFAVIGDGALTGGMAYEGINHLGNIKENVKIILNDNQMSISPNVGGLVNAMRSSSGYTMLKKGTKGMLEHIPLIGRPLTRMIRATKRAFRTFFIGRGQVFEELGIKYLGRVDGHDIKKLERAVSKLREYDGPAVLHVYTRKGKGYLPAELDPATYHGVGFFDPDRGVEAEVKTDFSRVFGESLSHLCETHSDIVAISAAMIDGTGLKSFSEKYPDRAFDVGIAEQHAVTLAAGMALRGLRPFVAIYSTFLQRAYDQILHDVCLQSAPVVFCIDRAGVVGADGETHQGIFDISYLAPIPNLTVYSVSNYRQLRRAMEKAYACRMPVAIRYPRGAEVGVNASSDKSSAGANPSGANNPTARNDAAAGGGGYEPLLIEEEIGELLSTADSHPAAGAHRSSEEMAIFTTGRAVKVALQVQEKWFADTGVLLPVYDIVQIKPFSQSVCSAIRSYAHIITVEDHMVRGGFGDLVRDAAGGESVVQKHGFEQFIPHGTQDELYEEYGLSADEICRKMKALVAELRKEVKNG